MTYTKEKFESPSQAHSYLRRDAESIATNRKITNGSATYTTKDGQALKVEVHYSWSQRGSRGFSTRANWTLDGSRISSAKALELLEQDYEA